MERMGRIEQLWRSSRTVGVLGKVLIMCIGQYQRSLCAKTLMHVLGCSCRSMVRIMINHTCRYSQLVSANVHRPSNACKQLPVDPAI